MDQQLRRRFDLSNRLYLDLVAELDANHLSQSLPDIRSNTLGAQLWCVGGGRRSYGRAIAAGAWQGFSPAFSSKEAGDPVAVASALTDTAIELDQILDAHGGRLDPDRYELALAGLEHESQHHGQLIRYIYALDVVIPQSWAERYNLR